MNRFMRIVACGFLFGGAFCLIGDRPALAHGGGAGGRGGFGACGRGGNEFGRFGRNEFGFGGSGFGGGYGGYGYGGYGWGGYGGCWGDCCGYDDCDLIPWFALHPPVYYSNPVPRTYGWSPWAYPSWILTPPTEDGGPKEIINPYVPPSNKAKPMADHTAEDPPAKVSTNDDLSRVQVVVNPYVTTKLAAQGK